MGNRLKARDGARSAIGLRPVRAAPLCLGTKSAYAATEPFWGGGWRENAQRTSGGVVQWSSRGGLV